MLPCTRVVKGYLKPNLSDIAYPWQSSLRIESHQIFPSLPPPICCTARYIVFVSLRIHINTSRERQMGLSYSPVFILEKFSFQFDSCPRVQKFIPRFGTLTLPSGNVSRVSLIILANSPLLTYIFPRAQSEDSVNRFLFLIKCFEH